MEKRTCRPGLQWLAAQMSVLPTSAWLVARKSWQILGTQVNWVAQLRTPGITRSMGQSEGIWVSQRLLRETPSFGDFIILSMAFGKTGKLSKNKARPVEAGKVQRE